jgi:excisionase family DNA binding protein
MNEKNPRDADLLTVNEAASSLRLKPSTVRDWIWKKKISYVKFSGRVFIRRSDIDALIQTSIVSAGIATGESQ